MAERSFAREVEDLRLGAGEVFKGEGILAITKALLQSGVAYVGGYQGSPISHLMDVLGDARPVLDELGVHFESSASEAAAAAMLAASINYPLRGAVTWKSTAGTNVASDALTNLASSGVKGGALVILGEDFGEGSSIPQERSHAFAMKSQMWLLDPRPNLPSIVAAVEQGFELSEASNTPVMLTVRIRACHVHGSFTAKDNRAPAFTLREALENPVRDLDRIVLPPASLAHDREKIAHRWPAAQEFIRERRLNEFFGPEGEVGIILQGGMYNSVLRALQVLGLADAYGATALPLYVLNVTYPLLDDEVAEFARGKRAVLMVEEGHPDYLEQAVSTILRRKGVAAALSGKDVLPMGGDYTPAVLAEGIESFLAAHLPEMLGNRPPLPTAAPVLADPKLGALAEVVPARPAGFCTGCPERPIFAAMKLVEQELGQHHVSADIGCHLFSILPPFNIGGSTMGYGLGPASASAFANAGAGKRPISILGDGGFWHNGLNTSVGNAVYNKHDGVIMIVDNFYSSATGGQDVLSSRAETPGRSTNHPIVGAVKGIGATWVRQIDRTYDVAKMRDTLKEALTSKEEGPKIIVASSECMLNRQRREKPKVAKAVKEGRRVVKEKFGVDEDVCTGDHACIRLSGCPSLSVKHTSDPLRDDPVAAIDESCVACGNCGEVAEAAVLCPSFYRAETILNPTRADRLVARLRGGVIGFLQRRRDRRRVVFG